jgi:hypothetical protein
MPERDVLRRDPVAGDAWLAARHTRADLNVTRYRVHFDLHPGRPSARDNVIRRRSLSQRLSLGFFVPGHAHPRERVVKPSRQE